MPVWICVAYIYNDTLVSKDGIFECKSGGERKMARDRDG